MVFNFLFDRLTCVLDVDDFIEYVKENRSKYNDCDILFIKYTGCKKIIGSLMTYTKKMNTIFCKGIPFTKILYSFFLSMS